MMFANLKLIGIGVAILAVIAALGAAAFILEKRGFDKATAELQPKIDAANVAIGLAAAANRADEATIAAMTANDKENAALTDALEAKVAAANQQAEDVASTIRKLQNDDVSVAAFLSTPIPPALRGVLNHAGPGAAGRRADANGGATAPKGAALPNGNR